MSWWRPAWTWRASTSRTAHRTEHEAAARAVRDAAARAGRPVAVMVDLAGPKVRLGRLPPGGVTLTTGATFTLRRGAEMGDALGAATNHDGLARDLPAG